MADREGSRSQSLKQEHREQGPISFKRMQQVPNLFWAELEKRGFLFLILEGPRGQSKGW